MGGLTPEQFAALGPAPAATKAPAAPASGGLTAAQFAALKPPVLNKNNVDVSGHFANPLNNNGQAVQTAKPAASPGAGAFFLGSLGSGVKKTVAAQVAPIKGGVNEVKTDTSQAFQGGINQIKQGASNFGKNGDIIGPTLDIGAGVVNTAFSPLAAPMKPVGTALQATGDKLSETSAFKDPNAAYLSDKNNPYDVIQKSVGAIANSGTIAQGGLAFAGGPKAADTAATKLDTAIEPLKSGAAQTYADTINATNKVGNAVGGLPDKVAGAVQDHYVKQVTDTWTKPAEAPKGFIKAQDIFKAAADKGHNIAQTLAENKINPSDNIEKGIYTTSETADQMRTNAGQMSKQMLRPSLEKADLTTPKTPVSDVISAAKESIKNNPTLTQEVKDGLLAKLGDTADALNKQHPDGMSLVNLHDEKIVRDLNSKYSPVGDIATNAEAVKNKAVADAARTTLEKNAPKDIPVHDFNAELTKRFQAANYLDALNGKKAPVGAFSKLANYGGKIAGLAVGHHVGGGILADVLGYHVGGAVERMFEGMSNPLRDNFLENLKTANPEAFNKVDAYLKSPHPTEAEITAAKTPANPNNLVSAGGKGGPVKELPNKYGPYDILKNRNTTMGTKLPPGTRLFSQFEKMFTPDQIKQAQDILQKMQNQGKTIDMKAINEVVKRVTPMDDVKPIPKQMQLAQDAARLNRISKIPVKSEGVNTAADSIDKGWKVTVDKGGIPGEFPVKTLGNKAAIFEVDGENGVILKRADGSYLYNPETKNALFDTPEKAQAEYAKQNPQKNSVKRGAFSAKPK